MSAFDGAAAPGEGTGAPDAALRAAGIVVVAESPQAADLILGALPALTAGVVCVLVGADASALDAYPADLAVTDVVLVADVAFDAAPAQLAERLHGLLSEQALVLLGASQPARDLAGALGALGARLAWSVDHVAREADGAFALRRIADGGEARLVQRVAPGVRLVAMTKTTTPASATASAPAAPPRRSTLGLALEPLVGTRTAAAEGDQNPSAGAGGDLAGARIVIAVGRGIGAAEQLAPFRELADRLGAALGATRVVVDRGWLPFAHQVGQTGAAVAPDLYIGFGVSGAVQHLVGMRDSQTIVVVNTDRHAPICELADVVVLGDAVEVAHALLARTEGTSRA